MSMGNLKDAFFTLKTKKTKKTKQKCVDFTRMRDRRDAHFT